MLDVKIKERERWYTEIESVRRTMESRPLSSVFFAIANGVSSPSEIARKIQKTKHTTSMHLSKLERTDLIKEVREIPDDLRTKRYAVNWPKFAVIFYLDHRLEFELYENVLFLNERKALNEFTGRIAKADFTITGDGKVGMLMHIDPREELRNKIFGDAKEVEKTINKIVHEFIELLKFYVTIRSFPTIQLCLLTLYKELKVNCKQLKGESELLDFFIFIDRYFSKFHPFEEIWQEYIEKGAKETQIYFKGFKSEKVVKQFLDAGWIDYTGQFILGAEAKKLLKPGTKLTIFPSYTYKTLSPRKGGRNKWRSMIEPKWL